MTFAFIIRHSVCRARRFIVFVFLTVIGVSQIKAAVKVIHDSNRLVSPLNALLARASEW